MSQLKEETRSNSLSFIGEALLYVWIFLVIVNMGLQNLFFSAFLSFAGLIALVVFSIIIEVALDEHIGIWKETKTKLMLNIFFIGLILFFFIFFSPDQRLWIIAFIPIFYIGSLLLNNKK